MLQLFALVAVLLPNDTEALRNQRESTAQCPLSTGGAHLRSAHNRHDRRYFVVFTRPHSGADFLCKLLNRHPEITCAGELFNPAHGSTERLGFTVEQQRADVQVQQLRLKP
jgi:hypothetical protein